MRSYFQRGVLAFAVVVLWSVVVSPATQTLASGVGCSGAAGCSSNANAGVGCAGASVGRGRLLGRFRDRRVAPLRNLVGRRIAARAFGCG